MRIVRNLTAAAGVLALAGILSACTAPLAPPAHDAEPLRWLCPLNATFPHGYCVLPEGVNPAPPSMNVEVGAPSAICNFEGSLFECPAGYAPNGETA